MFLLSRLRYRLSIIISIHAFANEEISPRRFFHYLICWSGICRICNLKTFTRRSHHHISSITLTLKLYSFSRLKMTPELQRKPQRLCRLCIKLSSSIQFKAISIAEHIMIHLKSFNSKTNQFQYFFILFNIQFDTFHFKGKSRRYNQQRSNNMLNPLRSHYRNRLSSVSISHSK